MSEATKQDVLEVVDSQVSKAIEALETAIIYNDTLTDEEKEDLQDMVDTLEEIRGDINA